MLLSIHSTAYLLLDAEHPQQFESGYGPDFYDRKREKWIGKLLVAKKTFCRERLHHETKKGKWTVMIKSMELRWIRSAKENDYSNNKKTHFFRKHFKCLFIK